MLSDKELEEKLSDRPAPRVTKEYIQSRITGTMFTKMPPVLTHCMITLNNGFCVTGESACASPENYDQQIGEKLAFDAAFNKLWPLFGFLLTEQLYIERGGKEKM